MSLKVWLGAAPETCDLCQGKIRGVFIDGQVQGGGWANLCPDCHRRFGVGLGTGRGQKYRHEDTDWVKVEG